MPGERHETILQLSLFPLCSSVLKEVCRKVVKKKSSWDATKSVSETDRRRSGQMAVSTKHVNNQIENKLNRLSVCWLHAAAFWVWWMCWGFFSVVIRVPYFREVRIFKLETYEVEDMPTIVRGTAGMRERSVLSELSGLENIKKICSLCYRLHLQVDTDLPLTCMTWNNSKMIQNLSASICVRIDSFSEKVWKVIRFICVINCLHKLLYLINWKTLWVAGLTVHCLAQWSFPACWLDALLECAMERRAGGMAALVNDWSCNPSCSAKG